MAIKKLLTIAIACIAPTLGAEGVVHKFDDSSVKGVKFLRIFEVEVGKFNAKIQTETSTGNEIRIIPAPTVETVGWLHNDQELLSKRKIKAFIDCESGKEIESDVFTLATEYPYTELPEVSKINFVDGKETTDFYLPLWQMVETHLKRMYGRPDQSTYKKEINSYLSVVKVLHDGKEIEKDMLLNIPINTPVKVYKESLESPQDKEPIYNLIAKQSTLPKSQVYRCYEHKDEWQQRGLKGYMQMRHWWETYNAQEISTQIYKISLDTQQEIALPEFKKSELVLSLASRDSGRTNKPECAPSGQSFPPNSRVV